MKDTCGRGHPYTPENTYVIGGHRQCRICRRLQAQARKDSLRSPNPRVDPDRDQVRRAREAIADGVEYRLLLERFPSRVLEEARR